MNCLSLRPLAVAGFLVLCVGAAALHAADGPPRLLVSAPVQGDALDIALDHLRGSAASRGGEARDLEHRVSDH